MKKVILLTMIFLFLQNLTSQSYLIDKNIVDNIISISTDGTNYSYCYRKEELNDKGEKKVILHYYYNDTYMGSFGDIEQYYVSEENKLIVGFVDTLEKKYLIINEEIYGPYRGFLQPYGENFSYDSEGGNFMACGMRDGGSFQLFYNDKVIKEGENCRAYRLRKDGKTYSSHFIINGTSIISDSSGERNVSVDSWVNGYDDKSDRFLIIDKIKGVYTLDVNGKKIGPYESIGWVYYNSALGNLIYISKDKGKYYFNIAKNRYGPYEQIEAVYPTGDYTHSAYIAKEGSQKYMYYDGKKLIEVRGSYNIDFHYFDDDKGYVFRGGNNSQVLYTNKWKWSKGDEQVEFFVIENGKFVVGVCDSYICVNGKEIGPFSYKVDLEKYGEEKFNFVFDNKGNIVFSMKEYGFSFIVWADKKIGPFDSVSICGFNKKNQLYYVTNKFGKYYLHKGDTTIGPYSSIIIQSFKNGLLNYSAQKPGGDLIHYKENSFSGMDEVIDDLKKNLIYVNEKENISVLKNKDQYQVLISGLEKAVIDSFWNISYYEKAHIVMFHDNNQPKIIYNGNVYIGDISAGNLIYIQGNKVVIAKVEI